MSSLFIVYKATQVEKDLEVRKCSSNLLQGRQLHVDSRFLLGNLIICDSTIYSEQ